jgi:hypothetical protein
MTDNSVESEQYIGCLTDKTRLSVKPVKDPMLNEASDENFISFQI